MGWALRSGDHVSNPTLEVHPHDPSREFRLAFRSVNLKVAHLAHIGTFARPDTRHFNTCNPVESGKHKVGDGPPARGPPGSPGRGSSRRSPPPRAPVPRS